MGLTGGWGAVPASAGEQDVQRAAQAEVIGKPRRRGVGVGGVMHILAGFQKTVADAEPL